MIAIAKRIALCGAALLAAAFVASIARAEPPRFTVNNRMAEFKVVNKCARLKDDLCRCGISCPCADLAMVASITNKMHAAPTVNKPAVVAKTATTRAPVGHTHTCPRCGTTWDHAANASHNCPNCGAAQFIQDARPRPVTVATVKQSLPVAPAYFFDHQPAFSSVSSGGCANGQCSTAQTSRGFFRR